MDWSSIVKNIVHVVFLLIALNPLMLGQSPEPLFLSVSEGDRAFIPCFNDRNEETISIWQIKGALYPVDELPSNLYLQKSSNGILVLYTTLNIIGYFTCYSYEENNNTLRRISTVHFTAHEKNLDETNVPVPEDQTIEDADLHLAVNNSSTIFIPCIPALGTRIVGNWIINDINFPLSEITQEFGYTRYDGGLIVHNINFDDLDSMKYECFNFTAHKLYRIKVLQSSSISTPPNSQKLKIVSRKISLSENKFTVLQIETVTQNNINCSLGNITFTMNVTNGVQSWKDSTSVYPPNFSPPRESFERNGYAEVYGSNSDGQKCVQLDYKIKVDIDDIITPDGCVPENNNVCCVTEGSNGCIQLPENVEGLVVIWPRTPDSELDCACGVFLGSQDIRFEDCYCLLLNLTIYNVTLVDRHLCWNDLTNTTNNTKVIISKDAYDSVTDSFQRTFQSEIRFTVEGPDPFPPMFTQERNNTLRIKSTNPEWSPVLRTNVTVYDNTGDVIQNDIIPSNDFRLPFNDFPESCAPFTVYATAHTHCSQSDTATFKNITNEDIKFLRCECLKQKTANLNVSDYKSGSSSIIMTFNVSCHRSINYNITNLYLEAVEVSCDNTENCTTSSPSFTIQCGQNSVTVSIIGLKATTKYRLSVVWISPQNTSEVCTLTEEVMSTIEEGFPIGIIVGIVIVVVIVLVVILTLIIVAAVLIYQKKERVRNEDLPGDYGMNEMNN